MTLSISVQIDVGGDTSGITKICVEGDNTKELKEAVADLQDSLGVIKTKKKTKNHNMKGGLVSGRGLHCPRLYLS